MPSNASSERKGNLGFLPILDRPRFCQFSDQFLKVSVVLDEPIEDETVDIARGRILGKNWVEEGGISDGADDQLVHFWRGPIPYKKETDPDQKEKEHGWNKEKGFDPQSRVL
jgi:hypothetical protein